MIITTNDRDEFAELVRHPKYARIVADLVADVNLNATQLPTLPLRRILESDETTDNPVSHR